jgi:hypothetical protein
VLVPEPVNGENVRTLLVTLTTAGEAARTDRTTGSVLVVEVEAAVLEDAWAFVCGEDFARPPVPRSDPDPQATMIARLAARTPNTTRLAITALPFPRIRHLLGLVPPDLAAFHLNERSLPERFVRGSRDTHRSMGGARDSDQAPPPF